MTNHFRIAAAVVVSVLHCASLPAQELSPAALESTGLKIVWSSQAVLNTGRDHVSYLTNDEELVYVQSSAGVVTALNAENGRRMWASQVGMNDEHAMPAASNRDTLLVPTGPVVNGLNKFSGEELFSFRLPAQPAAAAGMDENSFFIPLVDGSVSAFSLRTLAYNERFGTLPPGVARPLAWRYFSGEDMRFAPIAGVEAIAVGSEAGSVHAVNGSGVNAGKSLYQLFLKSPVSAPLTHAIRESGDVVFVATAENRMFCLGLTKGARMLWTYPMGRGITEPMVAVGDNVYVVTNGGGLHSLNIDAGLPQRVADGGGWFVPGIESILGVSAQRVYAVDVTQRLVVIDQATARIVARVPVPQYTLRIRNSLTDRLYLSTASGHVLCLAEQGSDFATCHQNPDRQPVMPVVPEKEGSAESAPADGAAPAGDSRP